MGLFVGYREVADTYKKAINGDVQARNDFIMHYLDRAMQAARSINPNAEYGEVALALINYFETKKPSLESFRAHYLEYIKNNLIKAKSKDIFDREERESVSEDIIDMSPAEKEIQDDLKEKINSVIRKLPQKKRSIIEGRFFANKTRKEIGEELNISGVRVRQIETSEISKLRTKMKMSFQKNIDIRRTI